MYSEGQQRLSTQIINSAVKRGADGSLTLAARPGKWMGEKIRHVVTKYNHQWAEGIIFEEACSRCGNSVSNLEKGVAAGRIKKVFLLSFVNINLNQLNKLTSLIKITKLN